MRDLLSALPGLLLSLFARVPAKYPTRMKETFNKQKQRETNCIVLDLTKPIFIHYKCLIFAYLIQMLSAVADKSYHW